MLNRGCCWDERKQRRGGTRELYSNKDKVPLLDWQMTGAQRLGLDWDSLTLAVFTLWFPLLGSNGFHFNGKSPLLCHLKRFLLFFFFFFLMSATNENVAKTPRKLVILLHLMSVDLHFSLVREWIYLLSVAFSNKQCFICSARWNMKA